MITLHFHLQPQYKYEFHIYFTSFHCTGRYELNNNGSVGRASHRHRGGHGFESRWSPFIFRLLPSNCLNWKLITMITLHFHLFPCWRNYRLKSSETIQLIIWALESHNIRSYGVGPTSTLSDIACNLFCQQRSRGWWIHWCDCSSRHKSCWIYSFSLTITTTSVSGNDRFRDSAFTPAFFGAEAAEMLLRFWPPQAFTMFATQFGWIPRAKQWWQTLFPQSHAHAHAHFPFLKHCPQRISCLWNPGELVRVQHSLGILQKICLFLFGKVAT